MAFSRSLRAYPSSRKKKKKKQVLGGRMKNIPRRNFFSATMRNSEAIPRARENLRRAEEERPQRADISNVDKNYISKRLNEITEEVLSDVRDENPEFSGTDEMFRLSGTIRDLNDSLQSTREKRQLNDLQDIMSNLEGVFEDINQTKRVVETGDVRSSQYNLNVQKMKNKVEGSKMSETPKSKLGHDIEAQLNDIDRLLYGNNDSPSTSSKREETKSERKAPKAYDNLLYSIRKLENKLSGLPLENEDSNASTSKSASKRRRYAPHHPPVITPLRDSRDVLHAPHFESRLLSEDDLRLNKNSGGTVPFYGASSRSTETALLFFQGKVREVKNMIRRNANEMNDLRNVIERETKNVARLQLNLNQLVPLVVELMMRQRKNDKEWCEIGESVREPLNLLNQKSSDDQFKSYNKNRAELEASELPDIATYVEMKLQSITSALSEADAILASTDFENDRQFDEEKRLDENKIDVETSKNLAHALDLDPLVVIPASPAAVSKKKDDDDDDDDDVTKNAISNEKKEETQDENTTTTTTSTTYEMTVQDSIVSVVDHILRQVETRNNGCLSSNALKSLIKEYFRILDVDQNPLDAYLKSLESHCAVPDGTISRALLRNTLVNTLRVTPNHLIRLASTYHVMCPNGLVVNSQWEDRVRDLEYSWKVVGLAFASKLDDGNGKVSPVALSEFLENRKMSLGPFESRLEVNGVMDMTKEFFPILKRDFFENISVYVRMARTYGIVTIPEVTQTLATHQSTCRELTIRAASPSDTKLGIIAAEALWELAHMYETSCEEGNQFRTIGLVSVLQHLSSVDESHHRLVDASRCLELFFASDQDEVRVMLESFN